MLAKTHFVFGAFFSLLLLPIVTDKWIFLPVALFCSLLPDIDEAHSLLGKNFLFIPLQFFSKHRGFFHSFSFCFFVAIVFALFIPVLALPFFVGYGSHLVGDSFSNQGIRPFWPAKAQLKGTFCTGKRVESIIFLVLLLFDVFLLILFLTSI